MHDPMTLAFEIRAPWPWPKRKRWASDAGVRPLLVTIWHVDPENSYPGQARDDDSCDWWGRARPLNEREMGIIEAMWDLETIVGNEPVFRSPLYPSIDDPGPLGRPYRQLEDAIREWRRRDRRWWQHPRWHVHHWKVQIHPLQNFKRWAFSRCATCGGRFRWGYAPISTQWHGRGPRWFRGERRVHHHECQARSAPSPPGASR